jgi:hypothetical protein
VTVLAAAAFLFLPRQFVGDLVLEDALEFFRISARDGLVYLFGTTRMDFQRPHLTAEVLDPLI